MSKFLSSGLALTFFMSAFVFGSDEHLYIIEGMHCGGCAISVESALERIGITKKQIIEIDYGKESAAPTIGHLKLGFKEGSYKGLETDCQVIDAIHKFSGYIAYIDPKNTRPCEKKKPGSR